MCVCFVVLPRSLQSAHKLLELINDNSDLSDLSSDEETEVTYTASTSQDDSSAESSESCSDSDSDDEPLSNIRNAGDGCSLHWKCSASFSPTVTKFIDPADDVDARADWKAL